MSESKYETESYPDATFGGEAGNGSEGGYGVTVDELCDQMNITRAEYDAKLNLVRMFLFGGSGIVCFILFIIWG